MKVTAAPHTEPQGRFDSYLARAKENIQAKCGIGFDTDFWQLPTDRVGVEANKYMDFTQFSGPFKDLMKGIVAHAATNGDGRGVLANRTLISAALHLAPEVSTIGSVSEIGVDHFYRAIRSIRERQPEYSGGTKYLWGATLGLIARELDTHRLTPVFIGFKNPFPVPEVSAAKKAAKLPKEEAIRAIGEIYYKIMNEAGTAQDRLLICGVVLLCCTGFRINELVTLPANCWHEGEYRDGEGRVFPACSIGYAPEKLGTDNAMNRIVAPALVELAKEALDEIQKITAPFRENALVRAKGGLNLPPLDDKKAYGIKEVAKILGYSRTGLLGSLDDNPTFAGRGPGRGSGKWAFTAQEIRGLVENRHLKGPVMTFPWRQELHESLFVVSESFFNSAGTGITGTSKLMAKSAIPGFLVGKPESPSCFERFGKLDDATGKPWSLPSHGFRHNLDTLFELSGFSAEDIASYFGRKDPRANENYNHLNAKQRCDLLNAAYDSGELIGPIREALDGIKDPIRRELARTATFGNTQLSSLGLCLHADGAEVPTIPDRCAVCPSLTIIKGHPALIEETNRQLEEAEKTYATLMDGLSKGYIHDGPWVALAGERKDRLRMMLETHLDHSIPHLRKINLGNPKRRKGLCGPGDV
jgi:hypothetical protein